MNWHKRKTAMALISDISLVIFLSMSSMSMQLWVIADLAGPIFSNYHGTIYSSSINYTLLYL